MVVLLFITARHPWAAVLAVAIVAMVAPFLLDITISPTTLLVVVPLVLIPWWLGPFVIWSLHRLPSQAEFTTFDAERHELPEPLLREHAELIEGLTTRGFRTVGDLYQVGTVSSNMAMRYVLMCGADDQLALVAAQSFAHGSRSVDDAAVEFVTKSSDGRVLLVNNTRAPALRINPPNRTTWSFYDVRDPSVMVTVHRAVRKRWLGGARVEPLDVETNPREFLAHAMVRSLEELREAGLYRRDDARNVYRPTLTGAFRVTWIQLPPIRWIRRAAMRRKTRRLLHELGLTDAINAARPPRRFDLAWAPPIVALAVVGYLLATATPQTLDPADLAAQEGLPAVVDVPADFEAAVRLVSQLSQSAPVPFMQWRDWTDTPQNDGAVFYASENRAVALAHVLQPAMEVRGFSVARVERNFGYSPDAIAVFPFADPFEVLAAVQTDGTNYDVPTDSIITWMRQLATTNPFRLTDAGLDYLEVQFQSDVHNADALAREAYAFCPDVVDQGVGTVDALADQLRATRILYCWWD
jgi:hypothetical protein